MEGGCDGVFPWTVRVPTALFFCLFFFGVAFIFFGPDPSVPVPLPPAAFLSITNQEAECTVWIQVVWSVPGACAVKCTEQRTVVRDRDQPGVQSWRRFLTLRVCRVSSWCHCCFNLWCTGDPHPPPPVLSELRRVLLYSSNALMFRVLALPFKDLSLSVLVYREDIFQSVFNWF